MDMHPDYVLPNLEYMWAVAPAQAPYPITRRGKAQIHACRDTGKASEEAEAPAGHAVPGASLRSSTSACLALLRNVSRSPEGWWRLLAVVVFLQGVRLV